jgi:hypothetical protein
MTQISQMTESRELSAEDGKILPEQKKSWPQTLALPPIICVLCEICGSGSEFS